MIPDWAAQYIGIPFVEKGEGKAGCNCWSLCRMILREQCGIQLPSYEWNYDTTADKENIHTAICSEIHHWCDEEEQWDRVETPAHCDLIMFRVGGFALHIALVLDDEFMLHVKRGTNACLERYQTPMWRPRTIGIYHRR